jgi:hypothetical protein
MMSGDAAAAPTTVLLPHLEAVSLARHNLAGDVDGDTPILPAGELPDEPALRGVHLDERLPRADGPDRGVDVAVRATDRESAHL